ncbi:MAG: bis(5'-nucleosyl)-tetraphosphatase (symmetrical) YqeK [Tissierellia bacterium]|nr:bis(5'-nucleosyl)-tetraphosphatase (symmetrical) YqeK [Tissierellia bacterium]MDD4725209.1 bis(5'-nucleosyl)-tetraphosphatase (symmetrical) YqeK [Tissierellia bacterium]
MKLDNVQEILIEKIGKKRVEHSIGVMETAMELAKLYYVDMDKAKIAGILHDCAKYGDKSYLLKRASDFDIILDKIMIENYQLIHGPLGAEVAKEDFGVKDEEILNAIRYHTTGRENMTLLDKIIYLADYIEPSRNFLGVEKARKLAFENLDKSLIYAMDNTVIQLIKTSKLIHLDTIKARNYLVLKENSMDL